MDEVEQETGGARLRVIHAADRVPDAASGAMRREAAISHSLVGAGRLWMGYVELAPGAVSAVHHHGESESAIYVISGSARFWSGDALEGAYDARAGDFVWVPPHHVHVEANRSTIDPVCMVVARSTQEAIVVNLATPDGWLPEFGTLF
ncbi:MAG TPA: cupin domain-containing protein [Actinomycetota bacterium]|nr:cupin domain-containing protein [Actinomycetota bacterium]